MTFEAAAEEALKPDQTGRGKRVLLPSPQRALASSAIYRMLAFAFSTPEPELIRTVNRACGEIKIAFNRGAPGVRVAHAAETTRLAWRAVMPEALESEYSRLFLGAGMVPLREGGYGDGLRFAGQPTDIADVSGFYLAFGFVLPPFSANPPDHLGTELEFMSLLHLKLALALQRGRAENVRVTRSAMAHFLEDHLGRWAEPFEASLAEAAALPVYRTAARLLVRIVEADCASLRVWPLKARAGTGKDPIAAEQLICPLSASGGQ